MLLPLPADKREVQSDLNSDGRGGAVFDFCLLFVLPLFLRPHHINPQETREEERRGGREDELGLQGRRRGLAGGVKEGGEAKNTSLAAALPPPHVPMQPPAVCPSFDCTSVSLLCVDAAV